MHNDVARCQALADELATCALHGVTLLDAVCHLRTACDTFETANRAVVQELERFREAAEQAFQLCHQTYCTLWLRMYAVLGDDSATRQRNAASVPIDPACALNLADWQPTLTLYNDNETLFKFAPSELLQRPGVAVAVDAIEQYYDTQCDAIETFQTQYTALVTRSTELRLHGLRAMQQAVRVTEVARLFGDAGSLLTVALAQLRVTVEDIYSRRHTEAQNCHTMVTNCQAKFNCCARLKDTMLRPYYLSRSRQPGGGHVAALF